MKQVIRATAVDESNTKMTFQVTLNASKYELTQDEQTRWKREVTDKVLNVIRDCGYHCQEIKIQ